MKIGIISGSVRQGRNSAHVARWVASSVKDLGLADVDFEVVPLADYQLPAFDSPISPMAATEPFENPEVARWGRTIASFDAYILVTPEYNHSVPGALKNAVDWLGRELHGKPIAFVSYGADGGVRATEHWRQIVANFEMIDIRSSIALGLFTDFDKDGIAPQPRRAAEIATLANSLVTTTRRWQRDLTSQAA
ncbi:NADPH-dependent oxidoreductase [Acidipropionibacterium jensenii]|uniref:NADPH-dependent oxidoreductase n=1 Tax=Acidipropionibacterium jensenii TaxID=1749 RepID=A0A3Q9UI11_9ACTN|nr:NAD(P)H-dependent oxidoreductase [Acidipropionibacterium jensenii]AZZ38688.1 NADPH-dependent oxidoreductase [Acidipropionibacterium jensenii]MDN6812056.1 NAD(P)H-dependent oxidoreductase [Acidipropionibacterium jensenii]